MHKWDFEKDMFFSYLLYHHETLSFHIRRWSKSVNLTLKVFFLLCFMLELHFFPVTLKPAIIMLLTLEFCVQCMEVNRVMNVKTFCVKKKFMSLKHKTQQAHMIVSRGIKSSNTFFLNICCSEVVETTKLQKNSTNCKTLHHS